MNPPLSTPEERFATLVDELAGSPGVSPPDPGGAGRKFGANAVKVDGKIFAMLVGGELVVKLPKSRVDELISTGDGGPFGAGKGRPMKEWVTLAPDSDWRALTREAVGFVSGGPR